MFFAPIGHSENMTSICDDCGDSFPIINEEAFDSDKGIHKELRCPKCQSKFRIRAANEMHRQGRFVNYAAQSGRRLPGMW